MCVNEERASEVSIMLTREVNIFWQLMDNDGSAPPLSPTRGMFIHESVNQQSSAHQPSLRLHHANATNQQHDTTCHVIQYSNKRTSIPLICQMMHSQALNFSELSSYGHFEHDWSDDTLSTL